MWCTASTCLRTAEDVRFQAHMQQQQQQVWCAWCMMHQQVCVVLCNSSSRSPSCQLLTLYLTLGLGKLPIHACLCVNPCLGLHIRWFRPQNIALI